MNNQPPEPFTHANLLDGYFRLVTLKPNDTDDGIISCDLNDIPLEKAKDEGYTALSHSWSDSKGQGKRDILVNRKSFQVPENIWQLFKQLLPRPGSRPLKIWIDALCINTENKEEQTAQVKIMGKIYANSQDGVLWLGMRTGEDESGYGQELMKALTVLKCSGDDFTTYFTKVGQRAHAKDEYKPAFNALREWLGVSWWKRVWVIQEIVLPPTVKFHYGATVIQYHVLQEAMKGLGAHGAKERDIIDRLADEEFNPLLDFKQIVGPMITTRETWQKELLDPGLKTLTLPGLRRQFATSEASRQQDLFYGLLGMVNNWGPGKALQPNYVIHQSEAIREAVYCCLVVENNLEFLQGVRNREHKDPYFSWLADFHVQPTPSKIAWGERERLKMAQRLPSAPLKENNTPQLLEDGTMYLKGMKVDKVKKVGRECEPETHVENVPSVLKNWMELVFGTSNVAWPEMPPNPTADKTLKSQDMFWRSILNGCVPAYGNEQYTDATELDYKTLTTLWSILKRFNPKSLDDEIAQTLLTPFPTLLTLVGELVIGAVPQDVLKEVKGVFGTFANDFINPGSEGNREQTEESIFENAPNLAYHLLVCLWERRMVVTEDILTKDERIGLAPSGVNVGDFVCRLQGSKVPFIVRESSDGTTYKIIGDAYVHGLMGEEPTTKWEDIALH
ncbi:putative heterokaryon incompatibility protein [Rosellinia necatrix]|uniref:Putative heterokaryon incompatibility protein n=1 Tax=Rosellinia necatrix TaxID=77044 RepID=A0A1S7UPQ9_ROSNE|nr:putative heterokaryon incompatibility protein [Rosellinia necatrix]